MEDTKDIEEISVTATRMGSSRRFQKALPFRFQHRRSLGVKLAPLPLNSLEHLGADHSELLVVDDVGLEPVLGRRHVPALCCG